MKMRPPPMTRGTPLVATYIALRSVVATLSILGSTMILISVLRSKKNRNNMQQRIIGGMSVCDLVFSFFVLTAYLWTPPQSKSFVPGIGNETTCNIQGFLLPIFGAGGASLFYNASLALYYLLVVKYNWKPRDLKKIEKWLHIVPFVPYTIFSIIGAALDSFNPLPKWTVACVPFPNLKLGPNNPTNIAIKNMARTRLAFNIFAVAFSFCCLLMVYLSVRKQDKRGQKWGSLEGKIKVDLKKSRIVAKQCLLFFLVVAVPWTFAFILVFLNMNGHYQEWMDFLDDIFIPSSGFLNGIVYFRLRYNRLRMDHPTAPRRRIVFGIVRDTLFPCCCKSFTFHGASKDDGKDLEPTINTAGTTNFSNESVGKSDYGKSDVGKDLELSIEESNNEELKPNIRSSSVDADNAEFIDE